jgi:uncharacterized protein YkwD
MRSWRRIVRYVLEIAAVALVLLVPARCGVVPLDTLGSDVTDDPGDSNDNVDNPDDDGTTDNTNDNTNDTGDPPADDPPTDDPPSDDPPLDDPPADDPPSDDPPTDDPPADDPPADDPPTDDPPTDDSSIPDNEYCSVVTDWPADWVQFEEQVFVIVNQHRAAGADCGSAGAFPATAPLTMHGALRCAARNHSMDMAVRDFLSHTNPDGDGPAQRLDRAGYDWTTWGENIAWAYTTPELVMAAWMASPGHCANIMRGSFTEIGVGYYREGDGHLWTLTFGDR